MGSTLTAMLWLGRHFAVANVGDSRAYLLRDRVLRQRLDNQDGTSRQIMGCLPTDPLSAADDTPGAAPPA
jgi:Protein phosphatase 2C